MTQGTKELPHDIEAYLNQGFRYALSLTHNEQLARDIVQDACMNMVKAGKGWGKRLFFTIIRNRFIDLYRRSKKLDFLSLDGSIGLNGYLTPPPGTETDLANAALLDSVLGKIPDEQREALYLSVVEGYTAREISRLTRTSRNTVLSRIHRARKRLALLLKTKDRENL